MVDPQIICKVMVFGYMNGIYSSRKLEQACRKNIDYMWLLEGKLAPDHNTFARRKTTEKYLNKVKADLEL